MVATVFFVSNPTTVEIELGFDSVIIRGVGAEKGVRHLTVGLRLKSQNLSWSKSYPGWGGVESHKNSSGDIRSILAGHDDVQHHRKIKTH